MKKLKPNALVVLAVLNLFTYVEAGQSSSSLSSDYISLPDDQSIADNSTFKSSNLKETYLKQKSFLSIVKINEDKLKEVTDQLNEIMRFDEAAQHTIKALINTKEFNQDPGLEDPLIREFFQPIVKDHNYYNLKQKYYVPGYYYYQLYKYKQDIYTIPCYSFLLPERPTLPEKQKTYNDYLLKLYCHRKHIIKIFSEN